MRVSTYVTDAPEQERFEARDGDADGELAGFLTYQLTGNIIVFTHLDISPVYDGRGIGDALARAAMDDAVARRRTVVPMCSFLAEWLHGHPEYKKIVAPGTKKIK
ncbi:GNAT family N-acetyltransferase [Planosporangium mesophilum]|uniref:GNAT family N-acetyltransferase n=1 Tax=Planosporangium mesophilum TaxID=689768 RepID=UPI00197B8BC5|nr:GNAT family N-acetyltransferase [Planosporangium mesophilum]